MGSQAHVPAAQLTVSSAVLAAQHSSAEQPWSCKLLPKGCGRGPSQGKIPYDTAVPHSACTPEHACSPEDACSMHLCLSSRGGHAGEQVAGGAGGGNAVEPAEGGHRNGGRPGAGRAAPVLVPLPRSVWGITGRGTVTGSAPPQWSLLRDGAALADNMGPMGACWYCLPFSKTAGASQAGWCTRDGLRISEACARQLLQQRIIWAAR